MITQPAVRGADSELVSASWTDPEAFAVLFDRYSAMLYRYVSKRLGPEPAEDLVGETFLIAFARRTNYDLAYDDARPWLFGILTKLVSRHHRKEAARYRALLRAPVDATVESPADRVAAGVTAQAVRAELAGALAALPAKDRDVLLLIAWGDLTYEEVARALGIPVGTVRSRLNRGRRKVRAALGDTNPMEEE
ncbi:sigma-70 family RNA polymerase sigma factor [Nonomuraea phyllanthi]|uniref:Sigma-70 family RNA polymerase sigma factor n=1 Tax=Nonomuraea phyllanthi TaxID=2219224 RepID=A0A5C4VVW5_9ACTN|nr:RNA polymerase sigma factor [Nonomuraea phyllanthi]KAB8190406.1 sigma-70 family RNA polymerase sigma factor [Nonomuraea phyllanthi]QFY05666.1 sigma-70 family RNA polymerase sigma factor [Nonomuraea phyllanthi]